MRFKILINKTIEIDTDREWGGDLSALYDALREAGYEGQVTASEIEDALGLMADEDLASISEDFGIETMDMQFEVPPGTTLKIPPEDEEDAA